MNSISPYTIRVYDPNKSGNVSGNYSVLGKVGQYDVYDVLKSFIEANSKKYHFVAGGNQIYAFHSFVFDNVKRVFRGYLRAGTYGTKTDIIDINTGKVAFSKVPENAEVINHYVQFFVPKQLNEGIVLLHNYKNIGIKTLLHSILSVHFSSVTKRVLQMNPLAYAKAYNEWQNAAAKEIKLIKFTGMGAAEDQIAKLGHAETEVVIKSGRKKDLGKLSDYFTSGTEQHAAVEVLTPLCSQVKTVVELGGRKRTFRLGTSPNQQVCEIEVDESCVSVTAGNPDAKDLDKWCKGLMNDFLTTVYPGMGISI